MTRVRPTAEEVGRPCHYCRFPLKQEVAAERCDACNSLHHADCWIDGGGCAVMGCSGAGTAVMATQSDVGQAAPQWGPGPSTAVPHGAHGQAVPSAGRGGVSALVFGSAIAIAGIAIGAVVATGVLKGSTDKPSSSPPLRVAQTPHPVAAHVLSPAAFVQAHYAISSGGSGFVNFNLAQEQDGWKVTEVDATCA